jgi:hypothetical protein
MKLSEELWVLAQKAPQDQQPLLKAVGKLLEDQRLWREAWLRSEKEVELLTSELAVLRLQLKRRKEKESND